MTKLYRPTVNSAQPAPKRTIMLALMLIAVLTFTSCRKHTLHGNLDGQWQITSIELADGSCAVPAQAYYRFYRSVVNLYVYEGPQRHLQASGCLSYDDGILRLDIKKADAGVLEACGMNQSTTTFNVVTLTGSRLTLQSDYATIYMRKF